MFKKLGNTSLVDLIYNEIKEKIIDNDLKPNERLDIDFLSQSLGVSRTPVINALKALEKDGYVIIHPRSSSFVRGLTAEETDAIFDFRTSLESTVIKRVINMLSEKKLVSFKNRFIDFRKIAYNSNDLEKLIHDFFDIETKFHEYMIKSCPSIISSEIMNLMDLTKRIRYLHMSYKLKNLSSNVFEDEICLHINLIDSLINKELNKSIALIEKDILGTKNEIISNYNIINLEY